MFKWKFTMLHSIREFLFLSGAIEVDVPYMNRYREGAPLEQFETTNPVSKGRYLLRHSLVCNIRTPRRYIISGLIDRVPGKTSIKFISFFALDIQINLVERSMGFLFRVLKLYYLGQIVLPAVFLHQLRYID